jgi:hypothetical protein
MTTELINYPWAFQAERLLVLASVRVNRKEHKFSYGLPHQQWVTQDQSGPCLSAGVSGPVGIELIPRDSFQDIQRRLSGELQNQARSEMAYLNSQLMHYGHKTSRSKTEAMARLQELARGGLLVIPREMVALEEELRQRYKRTEVELERKKTKMDMGELLLRLEDAIEANDNDLEEHEEVLERLEELLPLWEEEAGSFEPGDEKHHWESCHRILIKKIRKEKAEIERMEKDAPELADLAEKMEETIESIKRTRRKQKEQNSDDGRSEDLEWNSNLGVVLNDYAERLAHKDLCVQDFLGQTIAGPRRRTMLYGDAATTRPRSWRRYYNFRLDVEERHSTALQPSDANGPQPKQRIKRERDDEDVASEDHDENPVSGKRVRFES